MARTAIIVRVLEAEPLIGAFRRLHTDDGPQGVPAHVTLLYPFADTSLLDAHRLEEVRAVLAGFEPFAFSLASTAYFPGSPRVLYLRPEPEAPFRAMTQALVSAFPQHQPYEGAYADPIPHATVAIADDRTLAEVERTLMRSLPILARATRASLMEHDEAGSIWRVHRTLPLG